MGPVYAVATLSVIAVYLLFRITKKIFDQKTAYMATIFFALSAVVVNLARYSWNPNIAPFFSLLMFYFTYLAWKKDTKYWLLVAVCFSILIQLHYVTLLSLSGAGIIFLIQLFVKIKLHRKVSFLCIEKKLISHVCLSILIFLISLTPLILFDIKHNFTNTKSFVSIFTKEESFDLSSRTERKGSEIISTFITVNLKERASQILFESSFSINRNNDLLLFFTLIITITYLIKNKKQLKPGEVILLAYLVPGIIGVSIYQHQVYEHYIAYLFPFVYMFYGLFFSKFKNQWLRCALFLPFLVCFIFSNIQRYDLKDHGWTIDDMIGTSEEIYNKVDKDEKYNIVLLSESKDSYGMNYRYFLSTNKNEPVKIENHQSAKKLFIINEEKVEKNVLDSLIYEIVVFPDKNIKEIFKIENGPEITVLSSYNE